MAELAFQVSECSSFGVASRRHAERVVSGCSTCGIVGNPASAATAAFATLNTDCASATAVVNQANFGPFGDNGSCDYDCGFREQTWWWKADYTPTKTNYLVPGVAQMNSQAAYARAFQPTRTWVGTDMGNYGAALTSALNQITAIDQAIIRSGTETPAQAQALVAAFAAANTQVQNNLGEVNGALQVLASFISGQQPFVGSLQSLAATRQAWIVTDATNLKNNLIGQIACGAGDVTNSINGMLSTIAQGFTSMQAPFATVNNDLQNALGAASQVAGVFLTIQSCSQAVTEQIAIANGFAPTDPLRQFHLNIVATTWGELASTATAQLN